jgi:hypothetical protein
MVVRFFREQNRVPLFIEAPPCLLSLNATWSILAFWEPLPKVVESCMYKDIYRKLTTMFTEGQYITMYIYHASGC